MERQARIRKQDGHHDEVMPNLQTVEHILPKSPGNGWKAELAADPNLYDDCLHRLGNLCLLADANRALGNKAFSEKLKTLSTSSIGITSGVARYTKWGREEIENRQHYMAKLAVSEWRFQ